MTDKVLGGLEYVAIARKSLADAGIDVVLYDEVRVEPTDQSFLAAAHFAGEGDFDGFVSVGGGSVIDTCKAANLYSTHPAGFLTYVNAPIGVGYGEADIPALTEGAYPQRRLLDNASRAIGKDELNGLFQNALAYW